MVESWAGNPGRASGTPGCAALLELDFDAANPTGYQVVQCRCDQRAHGTDAGVEQRHCDGEQYSKTGLLRRATEINRKNGINGRLMRPYMTPMIFAVCTG